MLYEQSPSMRRREDALEGYAKVMQLASQKGDEVLFHVTRKLVLTDLFFLLYVILKRRDVNRDWIFDRIREVEISPDGFGDFWAREHYKAQRLDEPTPTPTGWVRHGDLKVGDSLFDGGGQICHVVALNPIVYDECYEITFDDGFKIQSGSQHLWGVERRTRKRVPGTFSKDGIGKRLYREKKMLSTKEIYKHSHTPNNRLAVRVAGPLQLPKISLPVHPYVLGVWLGDGTKNSGSTTDQDNIFSIIKGFGYSVGEDKTSTRSTECRNIEGLSTQLRPAGARKYKYIPYEFLRSSIEQRLLLLQGLMDTDGSCNKRGTATFVNKNKNLVDGIYELCVSLGLKPNLYDFHSWWGTYWQVAFQAYKSFPPFRLPRKVARCKDGVRKNPRRYIVSCEQVPSSPMRCIQVDSPDGTYLTSKEMIPTHNSTIITFAKTIQDILRDPNETVGIFSHTRPIAKSFLRQIKREFEDNEALKKLFPEILYLNPRKDSPKWSEDEGIVVKRSSNPKESTLEAWGLVDGQPTSRHFSLMVYDDVVTRESVNTSDMIASTTDAWALSRNLATQRGRTRVVGTFYHSNDTYHEMLKREAVVPRIYPAENAEGPVLFSSELLEKKKMEMGAYIYSCQMMLDPKRASVQGFDEKWLQYWAGDTFRNLNLYIVVDPANEKKHTSDFTVMMVVGLGSDKNYYIVDIVRDRLNLAERASTLIRLHRAYRPLKVGYEKYGMQADIEYLKERMSTENYRFLIQPLGGNVSKKDRISALVPYFQYNRIFLPNSCFKINYEGKREDLVDIFVRTEYKIFPYVTQDDMLDSLARILDPNMGTQFPDEGSVTELGGYGVDLTLVGQSSTYNPLYYGLRKSLGR